MELAATLRRGLPRGGAVSLGYGLWFLVGEGYRPSVQNATDLLWALYVLEAVYFLVWIVKCRHRVSIAEPIHGFSALALATCRACRHFQEH